MHRALTAGKVNWSVNTGVKRVDFPTGKTQVFDFGADVAAGEPVFAAGLAPAAMKAG
jgi:carotenoid cleavage dioxygenase-like enzyme